MIQPIEHIFIQALQKQLTFKALRPVTDQTLYELIQTLNIKSQELTIVLEELLMNSMEHGGAQPEFFYEERDNHFCFLLRDQGSGIHKNIPLNPRLSDTSGKTTTSILRLSLEEGITGTGTIGRGMGLFYLSKFTSDHNAESIVASNGGYILQQGPHFSEKSTPEDVGGTVILIRVKSAEVGR